MNRFFRIPWRKKKIDAMEDEEERIPYVWPKPLWKRILLFPKDLILLHIDAPRAAGYWLIKSIRKEPSCLFCSDPANFGHEIRRCPPSIRYTNLGVARTICPCIKPPAEDRCDIPYCIEPQKNFTTFRRLLLPVLALLLAWSGVAAGLYLYTPSRQYVKRVVQRRPAPIKVLPDRERDPEKAIKKLERAKELMAEKRWGEARIAVLNARSYDPDNVEIRRTLAQLYLVLRQIPAALAEFEACYKLDPAELTHFINFARIAMASRNHEVLLPYLESAPIDIKNTAAFKALSATVMYHEADLDRARALALEIGDAPDADTNTLLEGATLLLFQLSSPRGGLKLLERAVAENPNDERTLILLARAHRINNNFEEADRWLAKVEQMGSTNPHMLIERAEQYVNAYQLNKAIESFEYISGRNSALTIARARLAELYLASDKREKAKEIADELVQIREVAPYGQGHTVLAEIAMHNRFFSDAIKHGKEAMRVVGSTYALEVLLARAYFSKGEAEEATTHIDKALAIDSQRPDGLLTMAAIHFDQGENDEGLKLLRQVEKHDPLYTHQLATLGELATRSGNLPEARRAFLAILKQEPENLLILNKLATVLESQGEDIQTVRKITERLVSKLPDSVSVAQTYGRIILREGNLEQDLPKLVEQVEKFPFSGVIHAQVGTAYFRLKRKPEARHHFEEAIRRSPNFSGIHAVKAMLNTIEP